VLLLLLLLLPHFSITSSTRNFREIEVDITAVTSKFQNACSNLSEAMSFLSSLERRRDLIDQVFLDAEAACAAVSSSSAAPTSAPAAAPSAIPSNVSNVNSGSDENLRAVSAPTAPVTRVNVDHVHIVLACFTSGRFSYALILLLQVPEVWKVLRREIIDQVGASFKMIRGRACVFWDWDWDCDCNCDNNDK
jgi:hypothetical protein